MFCIVQIADGELRMQGIILPGKRVAQTHHARLVQRLGYYGAVYRVHQIAQRLIGSGLGYESTILVLQGRLVRLGLGWAIGVRGRGIRLGMSELH